MNTLNEAYVTGLIDFATKQRTSAQAATMEQQVVEISEKWLQQLQEVDFISKRPGKTIHLIKKASKPVPQARKRRKIDLLATPQEFKAHLEECKREDVDMETIQSKFRDITKQLKRKAPLDKQPEEK